MSDKIPEVYKTTLPPIRTAGDNPQIGFRSTRKYVGIHDDPFEFDNPNHDLNEVGKQTVSGQNGAVREPLTISEMKEWLEKKVDEIAVDGKFLAYVTTTKSEAERNSLGELTNEALPILFVPLRVMNDISYLKKEPPVIVAFHGKKIVSIQSFNLENQLDEAREHIKEFTGILDKRVSAVATDKNPTKEEAPYKKPLNPLTDESAIYPKIKPSIAIKAWSVVKTYFPNKPPTAEPAKTGKPSAERLAELLAERPNPSLRETFAPAIAAVENMFPAVKARLSKNYVPDLSSHDKPTFIQTNEKAKNFVESWKTIFDRIGSSVNSALDKSAQKVLAGKDSLKELPIAKPLTTTYALSGIFASVLVGALGAFSLFSKNPEKTTPSQSGNIPADVTGRVNTHARAESIIKLPKAEKVDFDAKYNDRLKVAAPNGVVYFIKAGDIVKTFGNEESSSDISDILSTVNLLAMDDKVAAKAMLIKAVSKGSDGERALSGEQLAKLLDWFNANRAKLDEQVEPKKAFGK